MVPSTQRTHVLMMCSMVIELWVKYGHFTLPTTRPFSFVPSFDLNPTSSRFRICLGLSPKPVSSIVFFNSATLSFIVTKSGGTLPPAQESPSLQSTNGIPFLYCLHLQNVELLVSLKAGLHYQSSVHAGLLFSVNPHRTGGCTNHLGISRLNTQ